MPTSERIDAQKTPKTDKQKKSRQNGGFRFNFA